MKRILVLVLWVTLCAGAYAQPNCSQVLRLANSTYEQGRLHELEKLLENCLKSGFTPGEKVQAYRLLTLAYIYLEEPEKADETMLNLLRTDPYFTPNPAVDPAEFVALYKTFRVRPIYRLGAKFSLNESQPNVLQYNPVTSGTGKYTHNIGFSGGAVLEVPYNDDLTLNAELHYVFRSFTNVFHGKNSGESTPHSTTTGNEKQNWISLPITAQYRLKESKFNPFVTGGVSADYLLTSSITGDETRYKAQGVETQTFSVTPQRNRLNLSLMAGAGAKVRLAGGYLVGEVRYTYGLTRINSASTLLSNQGLLFNYGYVDGIYRLNSLSISVGYVQNFFNPKKLKRKK